jgi:hypothetical protein
MPKIAALLFILSILGVPLYSGLVGGGVLAPLGLSAGMAIFAVATGWRAPGRGIFASALIGMCFATLVNVPIYFIGRWLGNPASQSTAFTITVIIAAIAIALFVYGWYRWGDLLEAKAVGRPTEKQLQSAVEEIASEGDAKTTHDKQVSSFLSLNQKLFEVQLKPKFQSPSDAFSSIITNKRAAGYLFGFHDAFAHWSGLMDASNPAPGLDLIEASYKRLFGEWGGHALFNMSISFQEDPDFYKGRLIGGNELAEFMDRKTPPLGLGRILILGLDA